MNQAPQANRSQKQSLQIDNRQLFFLLLVCVISFGHFVTTHLAIMAAGRDAWVSLIFGFILGAAMLFLVFQLIAAKPGQSWVDVLTSVLGKWVGTGIGVLYFLYFTVVASLSLKELSNFLGLIYPRTPNMTFLLMEIPLVAWVVRGGIEVMARVVELFLPMLVLMGVMASLLVTPDKDMTQILPVLQHTTGEIWQGTVTFWSLLSELIVFGMIAKHARNANKLPRQSLWVSLALVIMFLGPVTGTIMVFGEGLAKSLSYPTFSEIQYIRISGILERLDVVGVLLWTIGSFLRVSIFVYGAATTLSQLTGAPRENTYSLPVVLLCTGMTLSLNGSSKERMHHFLLHAYPILALSIGVLLPLLVGLVWLVKSWLGKQSVNPASQP